VQLFLYNLVSPHDVAKLDWRGGTNYTMRKTVRRLFPNK